MPASGSAIRAGRAFVEIFADDSPLVRGLRRAQGRLQAFGASVSRIGAGLFSAASGLAAPLGLAIKEAADAQESLNRFRAVFGEQADAADAFATDLARSVGRAQTDIRDALSSFQGFFVGLGFGSGQARQLSQQLQSLALDFASFNNLSDEEATGRFISALSGSSEVLDRFGINIKAAAIEQELLRMGIDKSSAEASEQEKALARLNIIMRSMTDQGAVGDAVKTSGSFVNQLKRLRSMIRDAAEAIGSALLPVVTPLVARAAAVATKLAGWIRQNQALVVGIAKAVAIIGLAGVGLLALGTTLGVASFAVAGLAKLVVLFGAVLKAVMLPVTLVKAAIVGLKAVMVALGGVITFLSSPLGILTALAAALAGWLLYTSEAGSRALEFLQNAFGPLVDTAKQAFEAIRSALMQGDIQAAAQVLWATLRLAWVQGTGALLQAWIGFKGRMLAVWINLQQGIASFWLETIDVLRDAWSAFTSMFAIGAVRSAQTAMLAYIGLLELTGQIEKATAKAMRTGVNIAAGTQVSTIASERDQEIAEREQQRQAAQQELQRMADADRRALDDSLSGQLQAAQSAQDQARAAFEAAVAQVRREQESGEAESGTDEAVAGGGPDLNETLQKIQEGMQLVPAGMTASPGGLDFGLSQEQEQFLALQAVGAGGKTPDEEAAEHLLAIRRHQERLAELAEDGNRLARDNMPAEPADFNA